LNNISRIRHNTHFKSFIIVFLIVGIIIGSYFGLQLGLNTSVPFRVVESGSMSLALNFITGPPYSLSDFFLTLEHPFDRTLDTGDIIVIQKVDPKYLNTNYPNSDIIVYKPPTDPTGTPIVHRIVEVQEINGTLYFQTKGDGNPSVKYPAIPSENDWDSHTIWHTGQGVTTEAIEGRVIMRIPLIGWVTLLMKQNSLALPLIIGIILLLVVLEFVVPIVREKRKVISTK
jgi:signal peptidase I